MLRTNIDVKHDIVCKRHDPVIEHCIDYDILDGWKTMIFFVDSAATLIVPKKKPMLLPHLKDLLTENIVDIDTADFLCLPKTHALGIVLVQSLIKEDMNAWNFECDVIDPIYDTDAFRASLRRLD